MQNSLDINNLFLVLKKGQRPLIFFVLLSTIAGGVATLVLPKEYMSATTVVPANPQLTDKNFLYGSNMQELSSVYGVEEDLDRLFTSLKLDGNFNKLVDSFKLIEHYKITPSVKALEKAGTALKKNTSIIKTENGAIKITVWDTDKNMAANLANALVVITSVRVLQNNQEINKAYTAELQNQLTEKYKKLEAIQASTNTAELKEVEKKALLSTIEQDYKTIAQLKSSIDTKLPTIISLEKAYPSSIADKPKLSFWLSLAFFGSLIFGILLVLVLEQLRKK
jgi:capsular polysaccharide biosynthesis protein